MAFSLKMPLYKLLDEMPYSEMEGWFSYFERRPVDWRDDLRAYYLLSAQGTKQKAGEIFPSLAAMSKPKVSTQASTIKNSMAYQLMQMAKGGDKVDFL